jgi:serine protease Do
MKFNFLFLLAALLVVPASPALSVPIQQSASSHQVQEGSQASAVYQRANPAVVTVYAGQEVGSGSIVSTDGLVLTNHHVARRAAGVVTIRTADGKQYDGSVIDSNRLHDLALIQIHTQERFPVITFASESGIQIGQSVYAIGSPYGRPGVMTTGTLNRVRLNGDLQANVVLEPGNSGGPLLNAAGEMIGINKSIIETQSGRNTGISLATSALDAQNFIAQTRPAAIAKLPRRNSSVSVSERTELQGTNTSIPASGLRLGIMLDTDNLVIQQVQAGSPAAIAGLRAGDRLMAINGKRLTQFADVQAFMNRYPEAATFTVNRYQRLVRVRINP